MLPLLEGFCSFFLCRKTCSHAHPCLCNLLSWGRGHWLEQLGLVGRPESPWPLVFPSAEVLRGGRGPQPPGRPSSCAPAAQHLCLPPHSQEQCLYLICQLVLTICSYWFNHQMAMFAREPHHLVRFWWFWSKLKCKTEDEPACREKICWWKSAPKIEAPWEDSHTKKTPRQINKIQLLICTSCVCIKCKWGFIIHRLVQEIASKWPEKFH